MATITLTAAMRSNLLSLQNTAKLLDQTQLRIATGNKVNSALDNPTSFFAAQSLNARSSDLSGLLDGMGQSIQVLKAADNGLTELTSLVRQAQAIVNDAYTNVVNNGGMATSGDISSAIQADLTAAAGVAAGDTFTLSSNAVVKGTITIGAGMTLDQLAGQINALSGVSARVVDGSSGASAGSKRIEITATSGETLTITDGVGGPVANLLQANNGGAGGATGFDSAGAALASAGVIAATGAASDYASREAQYDNILDQINNLIEDTGYQGTNLLNGDTLKTIFNEKTSTAQNTLIINGVTFDNVGLGISAADFSTQATIIAAQAEIADALTTIRIQAAAFGNNLSVIQTRQDFTSNLINILKEGSTQLTIADKNEEAANMLSLQTAQQLGIQALSLASQANQSVLRLFQ